VGRISDIENLLIADNFGRLDSSGSGWAGKFRAVGAGFFFFLGDFGVFGRRAGQFGSVRRAAATPHGEA